MDTNLPFSCLLIIGFLASSGSASKSSLKSLNDQILLCDSWQRCVDTSYQGNISTLHGICLALGKYEACIKPLMKAFDTDGSAGILPYPCYLYLLTILQPITLNRYLCSMPTEQGMQTYRNWRRCHWGMLGITADTWYKSQLTSFVLGYIHFYNGLSIETKSIFRSFQCLQKKLQSEWVHGLEGKCLSVQDLTAAHEMYMNIINTVIGIDFSFDHICHDFKYISPLVLKRIDTNEIKAMYRDHLSLCHIFNLNVTYTYCMLRFILHLANARTFNDVPNVLCNPSNLANDLKACFEHTYKTCSNSFARAAYQQFQTISQMCQLYRLLRKQPEYYPQFQKSMYLVSNASTFNERFNNKILFSPIECLKARGSAVHVFVPNAFKLIDMKLAITSFGQAVKGQNQALDNLVNDIVKLQNERNTTFGRNEMTGNTVGYYIDNLLHQLRYIYFSHLPEAQIDHRL